MPPKIIATIGYNNGGGGDGNCPTNKNFGYSRKQKVIANFGDIIELPCLVQANPWPTFTWYRMNHNNKYSSITQPTKFNVQQHQSSSSSSSSLLTPILSGAKKIIQIDSSLFIHDVSLLDSGIYVCIANNSLGQDRIETELIVKGKKF